MSKSGKPAFEPAIRYNWGYWDGAAARKRNRYPAWCRSWQNMALAHFDKAYGAGFHEGWHGYRHTETPMAAKAATYRANVA